MNDFVLRGFCKKCESSLIYGQSSRTIHYKKEIIGKSIDWECIHKEPVWFLSAKQLDIISHSDEYWKWANGDEHEEAMNINYIINFLNREPFLVAKILKEAGEKNKEENK